MPDRERDNSPRDETPSAGKAKITWVSLLWVLIAAPIWRWMIVAAAEGGTSLGDYGRVLVFSVLSGITLALYWLFRNVRDALGFCVFLAPLIVIGALALAKWLA